MHRRKIASIALLICAILFTAALTSAAPGTPQLNEYRPEGPNFGNPRQLPFFDDGQERPEPEPFSPDIIPWSKVVFQSYRTNDWEIFTGLDDGTGQQQLTNIPANDLYPSFNRGATRIVFASEREVGTGDYDLFTMNSDGSNVTQLTFTAGDDWNAVYSPDGTKVAFQSVVNNQSDVFVINTNGTGLVNLTNHPDYDGAPSWSPDGTKLAFVSRRTGGYRIYTMNANGTNVVQLSTQAYSNNPSWSPDGQRIAYDAVPGTSGWQDVWYMNADGSGQTNILNLTGAVDTLVSGWSPDAAFITYTRVDYIQYQGNWYWTAAVSRALRWYDPADQIMLSPVPRDWEAHWQTTDILPPQSAVNPLSAQSPNPIPVSWSGSDSGEAGLRAFDVQVRKGLNGPWTNWLVYTSATSGFYPGTVGGETYYFRSRAWDKANNFEAWPTNPDAFTTVENVPPVSAVSPLPAYTRKSNLGFFANWSGFDPGGSGIANYDVQYRIANGSWTNWFNATNLLVGLFTGGNSGQSIYFRSRAVDTAQNQENWPGGNGDTQTVLYNWGVRGNVRDNGHAPVTGATAATTPAATGTILSDLQGNYGAFVGSSSSSYSVLLQKAGYGNLPEAAFPSFVDGQADFILPPADDIMNDGGFESGTLGGPWVTSGGILPIMVEADQGHTGDYSLRMGTLPPQFDQPQEIGDPPGAGDISGPRIVTRDDDRTYLFWNEGSGLTYRWRNPDGIWSSKQQVGTQADPHDMPQVELDSQGNIHALWFGSNDYFYSRMNSNGSWLPVKNLNPNSDWQQGGKMVIDYQNQPHIVWESVFDDYYVYTHRLPNGSWTTPMPVTSPMSLGEFSLGVDGQGSPHIIWISGNYSVVYYSKLENGQWTTPIQLNGSDDDVYTPVAVNDGNGGVYLMWSVSSPFNQEGMYFRHWKPGTGMSPSQRFVSGTLAGSISDVYIGRNGSMSIVYFGNDLKLYYIYRDAQGYWTAPTVLGTIAYRFSGMSVVVDENERAHVVWATDEFTGTDARVVYRYQDQEGNWSSPVTLVNSEPEYNQPDIALDEANVLHLTYGTYFGGLAMYVGQDINQTADTVTVSQEISIPVSITAPVLSFMYQLGGTYDEAGGSALVVEVDDGTTTIPILDLAQSTGPRWTHAFSDLSAWAGQTITVSFTLEQAADAPLAWARVDEVTLGSGYPDLWSALSDGAGLPGQEVTVALTYGNQGGVAAPGVHITQTLPAGLTFVSASVAPISTSPLVWDVGDVPAGSGPLTILVTVKINNNAPPLVYLTSSIDLAPTGPELEVANNSSEGQIYTGLSLYMPVVLK